MSSTKDPNCSECGLPAESKKQLAIHQELRHHAPQATKRVDELEKILCDLVQGYDYAALSRIPRAKQALKALLTEARIDELEQIPYNPNFTIDYINERIAQLKNEATDPVKRVRELRDEWEQRSNK